MYLKNLIYNSLLFKPHKVSKKIVNKLAKYHYIRKREKWIYFFKKQNLIKWFAKNNIFSLRKHHVKISWFHKIYLITNIFNIYFFLLTKKIIISFSQENNNLNYHLSKKNTGKKIFFPVVESVQRKSQQIYSWRKKYINYIKSKALVIKKALWTYQKKNVSFNRDELHWEITYAQFMRNKIKKKKRGKNFFLNTFKKRQELRFNIFHDTIIKGAVVPWIINLELRCDFILTKINFIQNIYFARFIIKNFGFLVNGIQNPLSTCLLSKGDVIVPVQIWKYILYILLKKKLYNQIWLRFINNSNIIKQNSKNKWILHTLNRQKYSIFTNSTEFSEVNYRLMCAIVIYNKPNVNKLTYFFNNNFNSVILKK